MMAQKSIDMPHIIKKSDIANLVKIFSSFLYGNYKICVIKSNVCGYYPPDIEILHAILREIFPKCNMIFIGDTSSTIYNADKRLIELGLKRLADSFGEKVKAVDFSKISETIKVQVPKPHALKNYPIPKIVYDTDLLVNIGKIGIHSTTTITVACKNLFGLVSSKMKYFKYHPLGMDRVIADLVQIIKPDVNIFEASNYIVIGKDVLSVDIAASLLIGINPVNVKHLRLISSDRNLNLADIVNLLKESIE